MRRRVSFVLDAPASAVRDAAADALGATAVRGGTLEAPTETSAADTLLRVELSESAGTTEVTLEAGTDVDIPYFGWALRPALARQLDRAARHAAAALRARVAGEPPPPPLRRSRVLPPVPFTAEATVLVATVAALAAVMNFGVALFGQNADPITDSFGASNRELGFALAISRIGVLVSLVAAAAADRRGRRRMLLACFAGACIANAVSALAPGFAVFTIAQLFTRAFVNAALTVAAIAVIEEAPDGARAWSLSMLALAGGAGFAISVCLLPLADIGEQTWRLEFALSAASILLLPRFARRLNETRRYVSVSEHKQNRGRVRDIVDPRYGRRFALLAIATFLVNVLNAPSAQLTNRYLSDEHGFSNSSIAVFRGVTNGIPGLFGILLAGRLAETRGRRPVGIVALTVTCLLQVAFFLGGGATLWVTSTVAIVTAASAGIALASFNVELFPTEVRGTSNALFLVCGVLGSATGLLLATNLDGPLGGLGPAIALTAVAPLLAAVLVLPFLPEARAQALDELSPSEV